MERGKKLSVPNAGRCANLRPRARSTVVLVHASSGMDLCFFLEKKVSLEKGTRFLQVSLFVRRTRGPSDRR